MRKPLCPFIFAFILSCPAFSQHDDSLRAVLDTVQGELKVKTLNELFRAHLQSDPVNAVGYARRALVLATEISDKRGMAASFNNLGVAYRNQGALDKALEYYITSMGLYDSLQNREGIATTKNNIANIYAMKKDYTQAKRYLEESHQLFQEMGDPFKLIGSMNNLGNLYRDINMNEKALELYTEAYGLSEKSGAKVGDPLNNVGNIYFSQGKYDLALTWYEKALQIEREQNNKLGILNAVTNIGVTYTKAGKTASAQKYLHEALALGNALQALPALPTIYKASAESFAQQNKWEAAYEMQEKYEALRGKIYSEESSRNIAQMEMVLSFQEKERQIEMLKKEDEIKSLELRNSRLFIILTILAVIVVIGGINLFYLDRKRKLV